MKRIFIVIVLMLICFEGFGQASIGFADSLRVVLSEMTTFRKADSIYRAISEDKLLYVDGWNGGHYKWCKNETQLSYAYRRIKMEYNEWKRYENTPAPLWHTITNPVIRAEKKRIFDNEVEEKYKEYGEEIAKVNSTLFYEKRYPTTNIKIDITMDCRIDVYIH